MPTTISARLAKDISDADDKAAYRVLCGRRDDRARYTCGNSLGHLCSQLPDSLNTDDWILAFSSGWVVGEGGYWQLSNHAQKQLLRTNQRASSLGISPKVSIESRRRLSANDATSYRRRVEGLDSKIADQLFGTHHNLPLMTMPARSARPPCLVRCPKCGGINSVDNDLIHQARERYAQEEAVRFGR